MKPSELFEGENSSLKMTFNNAVRDSRCNQCKLENNRGVCDRNDCSNKSINTMRERFDTIFSPAFKAIAIRLNDPDNVAKLVENLKLSIEQELKKERDEIVEIIESTKVTLDKAELPIISKALEDACNTNLDDIINTIKNRV